MSELLFGHEEAVAEWVSKQPFGRPFHPPYAAIGIVHDGHLTGGFVFTGYTGSSINISLAGRGVLRTKFWAAVLNYVFEQSGCVRLECHTSKANRMVKRCLPHLGFTFEGKARRLYGTDDGLCFSLTVDDLAAFRKRWRL